MATIRDHLVRRQRAVGFGLIGCAVGLAIILFSAYRHLMSDWWFPSFIAYGVIAVVFLFIAQRAMRCPLCGFRFNPLDHPAKRMKFCPGCGRSLDLNTRSF